MRACSIHPMLMLLWDGRFCSTENIFDLAWSLLPSAPATTVLYIMGSSLDKATLVDCDRLHAHYADLEDTHMATEPIAHPVRLSDAMGNLDGNSLLTIAAFLATTAVRHIPQFEETLPPVDDLVELGFPDSWRDRERVVAESFDIRIFERSPDRTPEGSDQRASYYDQLGILIRRAIGTGGARESAHAVALGLQSPHDIVRVCSLSAAIDLFKRDSLNVWQRLNWYLTREVSETTQQILLVILSRVYGVAAPIQPPSLTGVRAPRLSTRNLILVHGTVFPFARPSRPTWSVPGARLFSYLQGVRPDIYAQSDYFRWEGGYSDYAREVAALNLDDWVSRRKLVGTDVVAHSHGCNVMMAAGSLGTNFGKKILLSCPVHWSKYSVPSSEYVNCISIRVRFDLIILADRANQRFPSKTIPERILPYWFTGHSDTISELVWQTENLVRHL